MPPEEGLEVVLAKALAVVSQCIKVCTRPEVVAFVQIVGRTDLVVVVLDEGDEGLVVLRLATISYVSREGKPSKRWKSIPPVAEMLWLSRSMV